MILDGNFLSVHFLKDIEREREKVMYGSQEGQRGDLRRVIIPTRDLMPLNCFTGTQGKKKKIQKKIKNKLTLLAYHIKG